MTSETIHVLNLFRLPAGNDHLSVELPANFVVHAGRDPAARETVLAEHGPQIRAIMTGTGGTVDEATLARAPNVEVITVFSAGLDMIDLEATAKRNIVVKGNSPAMADAVGEMAMALLMALARDIPGADAYVRAGGWLTKRYHQGHLLRGRKMGIVGLGHIGSSVARRAEAFGIEIGYTGRHRQADKPYRYFADIKALAEWADTLVLTCPGNDETFHLVDADVMKALGPTGYVINVARGTVVDEAALIAALADGTIAGAALDVFENEPKVPQALLESRKVILSPHQGSSTLEITPHRIAYFVGALTEHFG
jgi:lactate dehydrogenase-like 2-hydroxyacid dehydrogenase